MSLPIYPISWGVEVCVLGTDSVFKRLVFKFQSIQSMGFLEYHTKFSLLILKPADGSFFQLRHDVLLELCGCLQAIYSQIIVSFYKAPSHYPMASPRDSLHDKRHFVFFMASHFKNLRPSWFSLPFQYYFPVSFCLCSA